MSNALPSLLRLLLLCCEAASVASCACRILVQVPLLGVCRVVLQIRNVALAVVLLQSSKATAAAAMRRVIAKLGACLTLAWMAETGVYRA